MLDRRQLVDTLNSQVHHLIKVLSGKRLYFGRSLNLNKPTLAGHDEITIHLRSGILFII